MPASIPWRAIGAAATAAAFFTAGWLTNGWRKDAELAELRSGWDRERANQAQAQGAAINAARTEEQRRTAAQTEIANVATRESETARADARAASAWLTSCAPVSPSLPAGPAPVPAIPPLPAVARQPAIPSECLPTCSAGLTGARGPRLNMLTQPGLQGEPASGPTGR